MRTVVFAAMIAALGCGGAEFTSDACRPRAQIACTCDDGGAGWQTCHQDGEGWSACTCPDPAPTGPDSTPVGVSLDAGSKNPCAGGCLQYQVCSDGTDGHLWGECWGCNTALYQERATCGDGYRYYRCLPPASVPLGCRTGPEDTLYCCP